LIQAQIPNSLFDNLAVGYSGPRLARAGRTVLSDFQPAPKQLLKKPLLHDAEAPEYLWKSEFVVLAQHLMRSVVPKDMSHAVLIVQNNDGRHTRLKVFGDLGQHPRPAIAWRADFVDQLRGNVRVLIGEVARRQSLVTLGRGHGASPEMRTFPIVVFVP